MTFDQLQKIQFRFPFWFNTAIITEAIMLIILMISWDLPSPETHSMLDQPVRSDVTRSSCGESNYKRIQNYVFNFDQLLGQGNFSKVYKAYRDNSNQPVAIKIVELNSLKTKKLQELLYSEIDVLKRLHHPNVLKCQEVFTSNRNCYIITELCNQGDLESKLRQRKCMDETEAQPYIKAIFKGLNYLGDMGIVHRDLKLTNIFIHNGQAKIADFGFAKSTRSKFKDINIGSPIYMSPEGLINNIYGPKTDIWAFGMLIYELLHGQTPFSHCKSQNQLKYNISIPIGWSQLKPGLSNNIKEVILKCLQVYEPKRITVKDLHHLAYFRDRRSSSPAKFTKQSLNYSSSSLNIEYKSLLHSENNANQARVRVKTENEGSTKRQLKDQSGYVQRKKDDSFAITNKGRLNEEKGRLALQNQKHYSSTSNFMTLHRLTARQARDTGFERESYSRGSKQLSVLKQQDKSGTILSARITFRECVNILHYCRLLFKHLLLMRELGFGDEVQSGIIKRWLSAILKSIMNEINSKRVVYEGENLAARERKLQEVTSEYIKKYTREVGLDLSKTKLEDSAVINYEKMSNYFGSVLQLVDQLVGKDIANQGMLQLAHSMVLIVYSSKVLQKCYVQADYHLVDCFKDIEDFLASKKTSTDYPAYQHFKRKYAF